jgi:HEAT repeat protein
LDTNEDVDAALRVTAVTALGFCGDAASAALLDRISQDPTQFEWVRRAAADAARQINERMKPERQ